MSDHRCVLLRGLQPGGSCGRGRDLAAPGKGKDREGMGSVGMPSARGEEGPGGCGPTGGDLMRSGGTAGQAASDRNGIGDS